MKKTFTIEEAQKIGEEIGIDFAKFDLEQFCMGLGVELEHGSHFGDETNYMYAWCKTRNSNFWDLSK